MIEAPPEPMMTAVPTDAQPAEATEIHTRILRLALAVEESRAYWANVDPAMRAEQRSLAAFEQRWFGAKSLERVRTLLPNLAARYDAYPEAFAVLRRWPAMTPQVRQVVCHVHLQLADPIYRRFTGSFLVERRQLSDPRFDRDVVLRWLRAEHPKRWGEATLVQFASKLLSAASEAALISPKRDPRSLLLPKLPDEALGYVLHLLRGLRYAGTLVDNPYLASLGLVDGFLDQRLRSLRGVTFRRMGQLVELDWAWPSLTAWAEASL